ncbi:MAG: hypothetical protein JWN46_2925 [Acidimicrobiales bacterium]|nr:hypothetical protein [Acidimicrobiales bacterium]
MREPSVPRGRQVIDCDVAVGVGGMSSAMEVEAILYGALVATDHNRDILAVALNERFSELGDDHPVPYTGDRAPT